MRFETWTYFAIPEKFLRFEREMEFAAPDFMAREFTALDFAPAVNFATLDFALAENRLREEAATVLVFPGAVLFHALPPGAGAMRPRESTA